MSSPHELGPFPPLLYNALEHIPAVQALSYGLFWLVVLVGWVLLVRCLLLKMFPT